MTYFKIRYKGIIAIERDVKNETIDEAENAILDELRNKQEIASIEEINVINQKEYQELKNVKVKPEDHEHEYDNSNKYIEPQTYEEKSQKYIDTNNINPNLVRRYKP